jgi:hypothetical protein
VAFKNEKNATKRTPIKEHKFDLHQHIFLKSVSPPKIIHLEKRMNPSCSLFVDLPLFVVISRRVVTTPKVGTRRSSRIIRTPSRLVDFSCIITIDVARSSHKIRRQ